MKIFKKIKRTETFNIFNIKNIKIFFVFLLLNIVFSTGRYIDNNFIKYIVIVLSGLIIIYWGPYNDIKKAEK